MSKNKKDEKMLELIEENAEKTTRGQKEVKPAAPSRRIIKRIMSFDVYFQSLMKKKPQIQPHHKAPMRKYAEAAGLKDAAEDDFDRIFRLY